MTMKQFDLVICFLYNNGKKITILLLSLLLIASAVTYMHESKKINTYYFISEDTDISTTICKVEDNNDCLYDNDYSILRAMNKEYTGVDKQDNEFKIITNKEYHSEDWMNYKIKSKNNSNLNILLTMMIIISIAIMVSVYEMFYKEEAVEKYGTEE